MKKEYLQNFKVKRGGIENIDDMIDSFDLPKFSPNILILNDEEVCTVDPETFKVKFFNEDVRQKFRDEVTSSGFVRFLKNEFEQKNMTENVVAVAAIDESLHFVKQYYDSKQDKKRTLGSLIENFLKTEDSKQYEKLIAYRNKLKDKEIEKSEIITTKRQRKNSNRY